MGDILNFRKNITTEAKFANIHDYVFLFIPRGLHKTLIHRPSRIFENPISIELFSMVGILTPGSRSDGFVSP